VFNSWAYRFSDAFPRLGAEADLIGSRLCQLADRPLQKLQLFLEVRAGPAKPDMKAEFQPFQTGQRLVQGLRQQTAGFFARQHQSAS
jgi:hypothetical protein